MKVKVLRRRPEDYVRESKHDIHKLNRNYKYEWRAGKVSVVVSLLSNIAVQSCILSRQSENTREP